jgi:hypothetical protein
MQSVPTAAEFNSLAASVSALADRVKKLETPSPPATNILLEDKFDSNYVLTDGQSSPDGKWRLKYSSGGKVESANGLLTMYPKTVTSAGDTASSLLLTKATFKDFQLDFDAKLNKQTRTGSTPNSWESWWVMWSYNDEAEGPLGRSNHHYYFVLKTTGIEFGKKDNKVGDVQNEQQIFIKTANMPVVKIGVSNHITILKKAFHFIIKIDGITVIDMDDPLVNDPVRMAQGLIGLYEEDANTSFDNVKVISA